MRKVTMKCDSCGTEKESRNDVLGFSIKRMDDINGKQILEGHFCSGCHMFSVPDEINHEKDYLIFYQSTETGNIIMIDHRKLPIQNEHGKYISVQNDISNMYSEVINVVEELLEERDL